MRSTLTLPRYTGRRLASLVVALAVAAMLVPTGGKVVAQETLTLADFDATGKEVVLLALVIAEDLANSSGTVYQAAPRSPTVGSLVAGELGIGPDNVPIDLIRLGVDSIQVNHSTEGFLLREYFRDDGAGSDLTGHFQSSDGSATFPLGGENNGSKYAVFNFPASQRALIIETGTGDLFILAFYRNIPTPVLPPAQVSGVQVSALSDTAISVSWSAAANADGYLIQWATTGQAFDSTRQASVTGTTHTISGLDPNTRLPGGKSQPRAPALPTTARLRTRRLRRPPTGLPAQVSGVQACRPGQTPRSASVGRRRQTLTATLSSGPPPASPLTIFGRPALLEPATRLPDWHTARSILVRVVATRTGAANNGPPSDPPATATTNALSPPAQVSGVQASARSDTAISVSWSAAANADGYLVQWTTAGQSFDAARQASVAGTTHTITGLAYSTDYRVQVTATRTGAVNGPPSQPANARTNPLSPPQQVSGVQASARSDTAISVSWPAAANADGYLVQWAATGQSFDTARQASVTGTSRTISGLEPNTAYRVQVTATRTGAVNGPPSQPAAARTNSPPTPAQVSGVQASPLSDTEISVSWSAAANATAYVVEWRPNGERHAADRRAVVAGTEVIVERLESETEYFIRVFGTRKGAANGPASAEDSAITLEPAFKRAIKRFPGGNEVAMQLSLVGFAGVVSGVRFRRKKSPQRETMVLGFMCAASMILPIIGIGSLFWTGGIVLLIAAAAIAAHFMMAR